LNVRTTDKADEHIEAIQSWWRTHRPAAPDLFKLELAAAIDTCPVFRRQEAPYRPRSGIRRVLLRSTRNHVYYRVDDAGVLILAVWGAVRGRTPDLRPPR
jgi:plasmid stabilization system protein ParE